MRTTLSQAGRDGIACMLYLSSLTQPGPRCWPLLLQVAFAVLCSCAVYVLLEGQGDVWWRLRTIGQFF
jgi:hypothetical protein